VALGFEAIVTSARRSFLEDGDLSPGPSPKRRGGKGEGFEKE
jgi:hypothetical protein